MIAMAYVHRIWMCIRPWLGHASMSVHPCWTRYDNSHVWNVYYGNVRCIRSFARETLARRCMVRCWQQHCLYHELLCSMNCIGDLCGILITCFGSVLPSHLSVRKLERFTRVRIILRCLHLRYLHSPFARLSVLGILLTPYWRQLLTQILTHSELK